MGPNDADGMANNVDPDQTAPLGAVWSGSTLFAQICLSEKLGSLWYQWSNKTYYETNYDYLSEITKSHKIKMNTFSFDFYNKFIANEDRNWDINLKAIKNNLDYSQKIYCP